MGVRLHWVDKGGMWGHWLMVFIVLVFQAWNISGIPSIHRLGTILLCIYYVSDSTHGTFFYIVSHKLRTWAEERYDICTPFEFYFMDFSVKTFVTCCFPLQLGLGLQAHGSPDYCFANPVPSKVKTQERVTSALDDAGCEGHRTDCGPQDRQRDLADIKPHSLPIMIRESSLTWMEHQLPQLSNTLLR